MHLKGYEYGLMVEEHGGGCCGIKHVMTFPDMAASFGERVSWIKTALDAVVDASDFSEDDDDRDSWHIAAEVTLITSQLEDWQKPLEACGFREVYKFTNSNSWNVVHVFFTVTGAS